MDANFEICRVNDVLLETHLPPSVCKDNLFDSFKIWWDRRGIPQDRYRFDEVTQRLGSYSLNSLKVASNGMNLTDHYAISSDPNFKYSKSNFFEHEFSQDSGKLLFLEDSLDSMGSVSSLDLVSPNWCTNGRSQKRWVRKDGSLFLQKGLKEFDSDVNTLANQMIVSEICDELWVNYLPYTLNGNYIQCPNMCNIDDEFISAYDLLQSFDRYEGENSFSWIVRFGSQNGIDDSYYTVSEMRLVDKVTTRSSRTLFDFGFLRNADSLGNLRFAPMFDSGECHYAEAYGYTSVIDGNDHNLRCIMKSKEENQKVSLDLYEEVFLDMTKTLSIVDNEFDEKKMQRIFNSVWQELETA